MIKEIKDNNILYAKIIRASYQSKDTEFFTDDSDEIQLGYITFKKNHKTGAHYHNHLNKETNRTDEILIVQNGSARVDFYNTKGEYIISSEIFKNDILIIHQGGHNLVFYEDTKVLAIKSGVYEKERSKTRMIGTNNLELIIEND
ncbi:MAG: hypothetical protein IJB79_04025 [Candidatus Gastranaerophilales bacterium]|nr:hypothetical protein [Candidatus Gastranaerophilales bacterium]